MLVVQFQISEKLITFVLQLKSALMEAQKNASLLSEYHELYELQRRRLESQVFMLTEEREIWSTAAYCLAMKVIHSTEDMLTLVLLTNFVSIRQGADLF